MSNHENDQTSAHPLPTAIQLHEPRFPDMKVNSNASDNKQDTASRPHPSDGGLHSDPSSEMDSPQDDSAAGPRRPLHQFSRIDTDVGPSSAPYERPTMPRKSATERPRPKRKTAILGRKIGETTRKAPHLGRRATLSFDPFSSDSSSSSGSESDFDGEETVPAAADGERLQETKTPHQERKRRKTDRSPFSSFKLGNEHFKTKGKVSKLDGRLKLSITETLNSGYFAKTLGAGLKKQFQDDDDEAQQHEDGETPVIAQDAVVEKIPPVDDIMESLATRVKLNIVVIVIGSRGDIQPFLKIGKILKEDYGHRVRIATHPAFKEFVEEDSGLEFFSVGGDPSALMAFMVKNPGLIPSVEAIREGEIGRRRASMYEMFQGMWRACVNSTDDEADNANLKMMGNMDPFVADAIIANPPSFAPPHIAERLGIPLHMMFTFPYTPTVQFPHPLANIKSSNVDANYTNFMSYPLVEMMTWQGLGDLINRFRSKTLCLPEVSTLWAPGQLYRLKVPYTYMWSPGLVPKPKDWGPEIDIAGFVFLDLASSFKPPEELIKFLNDGPPPVYIGFGSIVVDDPGKFTKLIFDAVKMAGVRALVSRGWGGLGDNDHTPDNIFMLENTPHDWLFPRVDAVVHHGGAGTTAIGLKCGKPTMIVPFFGDQPFWGGMVAKKKAGAHQCIPYKDLTVERFAEGIKQCLTDEARKNAQEIADSIAKEGDGALNAVRSFHRSLPMRGAHNMRCDVLPNRVATWKLKNTEVRLSALVAELLVEWKKVKWNELRLLRHYEWNDFGGPGGPITGLWGAIVGTATDFTSGVGMIPVKMAKSVKQREKYYEKRWKLKSRQRHRRATLEKVNGTAVEKGKKEAGQRPTRPQRLESAESALIEPEGLLATELAEEATHGFKKAFMALLKSPMYITLALAQGFHNAPRLYGDETVRRPPRVTGFHSGVRAGRDELVYGVYDGVTGLWVQPYRHGKQDGAMGVAVGLGMGIGGLVLKDIAAALGPAAYAMKGIHEETRKKYQPTKFLRKARIMQGQKEMAELGPKAHRCKAGGRELPEEDEEDVRKRHEVEIRVSRRWDEMQPRIQEERKHRHSGIAASLLGTNQKKEGHPVPRKSTSSPVDVASETNASELGLANGAPKKSTTDPIQEAGKSSKNRSRGKTAPSTSLDWKEKGWGKRGNKVEGLVEPERQEMVEHSVGKKKAPRALGENHSVPAGSGNSAGHDDAGFVDAKTGNGG